VSEQEPQGGGPAREGGPQPSEEEVRAALEAELKRIRVDDVLLQTVVSLINVAGRKAGLAPGSEQERDLPQVQLAIEGVRALMPLVERTLGPESQDLGAIRDALARLQMAYAQLSGQSGEGGEPAPDRPPENPPAEGEEQPGHGPAQRSGRLWVPGD
jgi:hypothetical protein